MIGESKFLGNVQKAFTEVGKDIVLSSNFLLVERPAKQELKSKSGLILTQGTEKQVNSIEANLPEWVHVLATGAGYYDEETGEDRPLDSKPGDVILVGRNDVKWFSKLGCEGNDSYIIGICQEEATQLRFSGYEGYRRWIEALNREA